MAKKTKSTLKTPEEIKEYLDQYVIGQDEAKKVLSVAVYNHYKRILNSNHYFSDVEMDKSNVILLGETGSGKTLLAKTIARLLDVPCYIQDCTKLTQSGYVGSDVEDCLVGLLRATNYDIERAEMGIVVLDEIDKCAKRDAGPSITRDVSGEGVQQSLLKIVEGDLVGVPPAGGRKHPEQQLLYINTKNILFIASGAFVGLEDIIRKRLGSRKIGFDADYMIGTDEKSVVKYATTQDLREFGIIPEFVGRFPIITNVEKLSKEDLIRILKEPKNSIIKQYSALLAMDNTKLSLTDDAVLEIATLANNLGTGARGLRNIVETVMTDIMYEAPRNGSNKKPVEITVDGNYVIEKTKDRFRGAKAAS